jgi:hypothetical protein
MTTTLQCRHSSGSWTGAVPLRHIDTHFSVAKGGLERSSIRRTMRGTDRRALRCFHELAARTEVRFTVHQGRAIEIETSNECLRDVITALEFANDPSFTKVTWKLDYTAKDPASAPRLSCAQG